MKQNFVHALFFCKIIQIIQMGFPEQKVGSKDEKSVRILAFLSNEGTIWYKYTTWKVSVFGVILVRIFPHSDWIWRDDPYLSIFSPNAGKKRTRITPNTSTFYAVACVWARFPLDNICQKPTNDIFLTITGDNF